MTLSQVQKWVMSVLAVTTILHLSAGLIVAAVMMDNPQRGADVGLTMIAAALGVVSVATGLLIHERSPFSWWLLLGLIPGVVGLALI